jgi:hypothetical protein
MFYRSNDKLMMLKHRCLIDQQSHFSKHIYSNYLAKLIKFDHYRKIGNYFLGGCMFCKYLSISNRNLSSLQSNLARNINLMNLALRLFRKLKVRNVKLLTFAIRKLISLNSKLTFASQVAWLKNRGRNKFWWK